MVNRIEDVTLTRRAAIVMLGLSAACGPQRELSPIRLEPVVTLGETSGDGGMTSSPYVSARQPLGFRVVVQSPSAVQSWPLVFDDSGHYVARLTLDSGNGERAQARFARIGPGDSIWVFDDLGGVRVFSPNRSFTRQFMTMGATNAPKVFRDAIVLADGRIVGLTNTATRGMVFGADGALQREIGRWSLNEESGAEPMFLVGRDSNSFWTTSPRGQSILERWDVSGQLLDSLALDIAWLTDSAAHVRTQAPTQWHSLPPLPALRGIWFDRVGRLWLVGEAVDPRWRNGIVVSDSTGKRHIEPDRYFDTVVEVRDARTGMLIASSRFDIDCKSLAEPGVLVHEVVTKAGWVRAELFRVVLDEALLKARKP